MQEKNLEEKGEGQAIATKKECNKEEALRTIRLLEKGTRQAFLDGELGVEDTKGRLDQVEQAYKRCEAGDVDACEVLDGLMAGLTRRRE